MTFGGETIDDVNRPLLDLQKIIVHALPLGLRATSPNGREYFSNYFIASERTFRPADKLPLRTYAHVLVLGDQRPYTIQVFVRNERARSANEYSDAGGDSAMAKVIQRRIKDQLSKRREDINIIDDFRVF